LDGLQHSEVWFGAVPRPIENVCSDESTSLFLTPSLVGSDVIYALRRNTADEATAYRFRRYAPADGSRTEVAAPPYLVSAAWTPTTLYDTASLSDRDGNLRNGYGLYEAPLPAFK
jgi:hypothetical protein